VKPIDLVIGLSIRLLFRKQLLCWYQLKHQMNNFIWPNATRMNAAFNCFRFLIVPISIDQVIGVLIAWWSQITYLKDDVFALEVNFLESV
jgi:hypothetical protein